MFPARTALLRFALVFAGTFALLASPFDALADTYSSILSDFGNTLVEFRTFDSGASLHFEAGANQKPDAGREIEHWQSVLFVEKGKAVRIRVPIDLRSLGYLPLAAFVALAAATPTALRRRLRLLGIGLSVLFPFTLVLLASTLALLLGGGELPLRVFVLSPGVRLALSLIQRALVSPPGMTYAIPALLWWALLWLTRPPTSTVAGGAPDKVTATAF